MPELVAGVAFGGILPEFLKSFRSTFFGWKGVANRALERIRRDGSCDFQICFQEMQEQAVFAQLLPFRKAELRDELFIALRRRHRQERTAAG